MSPLLPWMILCSVLLASTSLLELIPDQSSRDIIDGPPSNFLTLLRKKWFKILLSAILGGASVTLTTWNSSLSGQQTQAKLDKRDSANRKHTDSMLVVTADSLNATFTKGLNEYYLTWYKDRQQVRSLIRDSINMELPGLDIYPALLGVINTQADSLSYQFSTKNSGNCQITVNFTTYAGFHYEGGIQSCKSTVGAKNVILAQHADYNYPLSIYCNPIPNRIYLLVLGTFHGFKDTTPRPIHELFVWDIKSNTGGSLTDFKLRDSIESVMRMELRIKGR